MRLPPKSAILMGVALVTLGLILLDRLPYFSSLPEEAAMPLPTQTAPNVTFTLLDGSALPLRSLAGHRVLLHFWASWCVPCRQEFSDLLTQLANSRDTVLLAVSGDAHQEDAERFIEPLERQFPDLFKNNRVIVADDPTHVLIEGLFQTFQYPETIVIGPNLAMRQKIIGPMTAQDMQNAMP